MPRLLELFSGTGSIGRAFIEKGWEVVSVDLDPKANATITANILTWDYEIYEPGYFDCVWASPVCTHYSIARTTARTPRDLDGSDRLVQKVIDIIEFYKPASFFLENPKTGLLKTRSVIAGIPFKDISYCKYGFAYKKATRIWTNCDFFQPKKTCCKLTPCSYFAELGHHEMTAQRGPGRLRGILKPRDKCSLNELYSMPSGLCKEIALAATLSQVGRQ
jgi:hypothetical protein